jgi:inorganic pyrophosphatase
LKLKRLEPRKWAKFKEWKNAHDAAAIVISAMEKYKKKADLYQK